MLRITDDIALADWELSESFIRASGPGGQNVNKVSTAVAVALRGRRGRRTSPPEVKARLKRLAGWRWTADGALIVTSDRHRSQALNREDAREKLRELVLAALERPSRAADAADRRLGAATARRQGPARGGEGGADLAVGRGMRRRGVRVPGGCSRGR